MALSDDDLQSLASDLELAAAEIEDYLTLEVDDFESKAEFDEERDAVWSGHAGATLSDVKDRIEQALS